MTGLFHLLFPILLTFIFVVK